MKAPHLALATGTIPSVGLGCKSTASAASASSRELEAATSELRGAAQVKRLKARALEAPVAKVEAACKACHEEFRIY